MLIKKYITRKAKEIISAVNFLIPKNSKKILFKSKPDFSGNAKALSDYIQKAHPHYKIVWLANKKTKKQKSSIKIYKEKSWLGLYNYFTARYIVTTHNEMIGIKSANQIYISLWHGMPLKKICYLGEFDHKGMEDYSAKRIATSEIMRSIIAACFREKANNVFITGQPRNDFLFNKMPAKKIIDDFSKDKKKILYAPTFRENQESHEYSDGEAIKSDNFLRVNDFDIKELDTFLERNNTILFVKLHPYEEKSFSSERLTNNIIIIKTELLNYYDADINHLLAWMDVLITDYSSVYFDYMILNKPMLFLIPDLKDYSSSRGGFSLQPIEYWMPGPKIISLSEMLSEIKDIFDGNDSYVDKRKSINKIINYYNDDKNSERVFNEFIK